jgi:hypothetical protein
MINPTSRAPLTGDTADLRDAAAVIAALDRKDIEGIQVLIKYLDPTALAAGCAQLLVDALGEPRTSDLGGYLARVFDRLDRGQS